MSPQTKTKLGKFFNSNAFVTSLAVALIMFFVNYKSSETKQAHLEAKSTYKLMMETVIPEIKALNIKTDNVDKYSNYRDETIKSETSEKIKTIYVVTDNMKEDINKLENKLYTIR